MFAADGPEHRVVGGAQFLTALHAGADLRRQGQGRAARGAEAFAATGTEGSKGTKILALTGRVRNTGLVEVAMGTTLNTVVNEIGGGSSNGNPIKAVQTGGPSGGCIPMDKIDMAVDYGIDILGAVAVLIVGVQMLVSPVPAATPSAGTAKTMPVNPIPTKAAMPRASILAGSSDVARTRTPATGRRVRPILTRPLLPMRLSSASTPLSPMATAGRTA